MFYFYLRICVDCKFYLLWNDHVKQFAYQHLEKIKFFYYIEDTSLIINKILVRNFKLAYTVIFKLQAKSIFFENYIIYKKNN